MKTSLLEKLLDLYRDDPADPFNLYALALEYQKTNTSESRRCFELLLEEFPNYLPTYYTAAQFFINLEENSLAEQIFQKGIPLAQSQQKARAHQELVRAYQAFQDEHMDW